MVRFENAGKLYALYVPVPSAKPVEFYTGPEDSIQVGSFSRPAGYAVPQHTHLIQYRPSGTCQEVIMVRSGSLLVRVWDDNRLELGSCAVGPGETVILLAGWHSVQVREECSFIEVKTGPYSASAKVFAAGYREA